MPKQEIEKGRAKWDSGLWIRYKVFEDTITLAPGVDPVKHGHWIPIKEPTGVEAFGVKEMTVQSIRCSACNAEEDVSSSVYDYCPWCGAIMDGEVKRNE